MRYSIAICFALLSLIPSISFSAKDSKELKGQITGVGPDTLVIHTEENVKVGDTFHFFHGGKRVAVVKVRAVRTVKGMRGTIVITDIVEKLGVVSWGDKIIKVTEPPTPENEKQKETPPETPTSTETNITETQTTTPSQEKPEEETVVMPPSETKKPIPVTSKETPTVIQSETPVTETSPSVTPSEAKESPEEIAKASETQTAIPSEEEPQRKQSSISFGYSMFAPLNLKFSNSGFFAEINYKFSKIPRIFLSMQHSIYRWSDSGTVIDMDLSLANLNYKLHEVPLRLTHHGAMETFITLGYSVSSGDIQQQNITKKISFSGINYGLSILMLKHLKIEYKFHRFNFQTGAYKMKNGNAFQWLWRARRSCEQYHRRRK